MIPALFVRRTSIYRDLGADCWDIDRDARGYAGALPVVAHPPCRAWGQLSAMAKPRADERDLALFAIDTVRRVGGVVEHPSRSKLWSTVGASHVRDQFGGYVVHVLQSWFGHRAQKSTGLYIVGVDPADLPSIPFALGTPPGRIELMGRPERERTPPALATWLLAVAGKAVH